MVNRPKVALIFLTMFLLSASALFAAGTANLYLMFRDKTVKVYVAEAKDSTKEHETDPKVIKQKIEDALKARKSITFDVVQDARQADLLIDVDVAEYMWTDHDPVDMLVGAAAIAYDIATIEDYARLQADITVTDARSKKALWKDRVVATITKKPMSRTESIPLVSDVLAKTFIKECFSKKGA